MKQFIKYLLASTIGTVLGLVLIMVISGIIMVGVISSAVMMAGSAEKEVKVKPSSLLVVDMSKAIVERTEKQPFEGFEINGIEMNKGISIMDFMESIEAAKTDSNIKGILLKGMYFNGGMSKAGDVRAALKDFKESGKFIVAYDEAMTQGAYYIASVADEVYLFHEGAIDFRGLRTELAFFKGTLDRLGIKTQVVRGKNNIYKSAVEPFTRTDMSPENRTQVTELVTDIWGVMLADLQESRGIDVAELNRIADEMAIRKPEDAIELKLIDGLMYNDQLEALLREKLGLEEDDKMEKIGLSKYANVDHKPANGGDEKVWELQDEIAVIYANGGIGSGEGDNENIGSETLAEAIKKAREDEDVKAIVMRVNSPGGSALASEVIWREAVLAQEAKPFVVSFGDVAASGGYYISTHADHIFAQPNTITGSIGAFGIIPEMQEFFNDKMGITFDVVKTNEHSDLGTLSRPFDEAELALIQGYLDQVYTEFVEKVADGRGKSYEYIDSIGRGRVWTGQDALEIGLVDEMGDLQAAIDYAAEMAELDKYEILELPKQKDPFEKFILELTGNTRMTVASWVLEEDEMRWFSKVEDIKQMNGVQMRMLYDINVR